MSNVLLVHTRTQWDNFPVSHVPVLKDRASLVPRMCPSVEVSVQLVSFLMMGSAHAGPVHWASTSQNQAEFCASPVEEAS